MKNGSPLNKEPCTKRQVLNRSLRMSCTITMPTTGEATNRQTYLHYSITPVMIIWFGWMELMWLALVSKQHRFSFLFFYCTNANLITLQRFNDESSFISYTNEIITKILWLQFACFSQIHHIDSKMQLSSEQTVTIATLFLWLTSKCVDHS